MKHILSLPKIGNLKLGVVRNGAPIQTSRILVTLPTKEGSENFKIYPGFNEEGEEKVDITLPFDSPELNFEVNYVGFLVINDIEYIAKAKDLGEPLYFYPMNPENFNEKVIDAGELTDELIEKYNMVKTGFLKVMLRGVSGFGEVFYFKTKSVNSIRAISDQMAIISALTGGKLAGLPLVLKPVKKDVGDKQIVYMSLSYDSNMFSGGFPSLFSMSSADMKNYINDRKSSPINIAAFEELYVNSRNLEEDDIVALADLTDVNIKIERDAEKEISEIITESEKAEMSEEELYVTNLFQEKEYDIPVPMGLAVLNSLNGNRVSFEEYMETNPTPSQCAKKIKELS